VIHLDRALTICGGDIVRADQPPGPAVPLPWLPAGHVERRRVRIETPAGCRWSDVEIARVTDDIVAVRVKESAPVRIGLAELGLSRQSTGVPNVQWGLLLALCEGSGRCTRRDVGAGSIDVLKTRAIRLRRRLSEVFGIAEPGLHFSSEDESVTAVFRALAKPHREVDKDDNRPW
jgi:hypothetical protein